MNCFKSALDALRISIDDTNQGEIESDDDDAEEMDEQSCDNLNYDDDSRLRDEIDENVTNPDESLESSPAKSTPRSVEAEKPEIVIKTEPEWDEDIVVVKEEPTEPVAVKEKSELKVTKMSAGVIRIRSPQSINEKAKIVPKVITQSPQQPQISLTVDEKANIQELSKRLSKAILIRRVKKSDGTFSQHRSPVKIIQGMKIQKVGNANVQHRDIPMRPQIRQVVHQMQNKKVFISGGERRGGHTFRCSYCEKLFSVNKRRNAHEKFCFKNPSRPSSQCPYCPMILCNPMYISTHIKKVHGIDDNGQKIVGDA